LIVHSVSEFLEFMAPIEFMGFLEFTESNRVGAPGVMRVRRPKIT
jgi:hypothetical protein